MTYNLYFIFILETFNFLILFYSLKLKDKTVLSILLEFLKYYDFQSMKIRCGKIQIDIFLPYDVKKTINNEENCKSVLCLIIDSK